MGPAFYVLVLSRCLAKMQSLIVKELKLKYRAVAIYFSDTRPDGANQFREDNWGCAMAMYNMVMKVGRTAVFDRKTYGCIGAGVGLCLGNTYQPNREFMQNLLADEEGYFKNHELVRDFMDNFRYVDSPYRYVIFTPLEQWEADGKKPVLVSFPANPDQLAALAALLNFGRPGNEHVSAPFGAGCQSVCVLPFNEVTKDYPRGIIGNLDLTSRRILPPDILTFTVPFGTFLEMEENLPRSFVRKDVWEKIVSRIGGDSEQDI